MKTQQKREIATSLTTFGFLVIGTTGILMYFHILDKYTKELHEILGLAFVVIVGFHLIYNWKSFKNYFKSKVFYASAILFLAISLGFILNAPDVKNPKGAIFDAMLNSPIEKTFVLFSKDYETAKQKLTKMGFTIKDGSSLEDLAKINKTSPFELVSKLVQE